jgi:hypothetical protein
MNTQRRKQKKLPLPGIEPGLRDSESHVMPLDHKGTIIPSRRGKVFI